MREQLPLGLDDVAPTPRRRQRRAFHSEHVHMTVEEAQAGEKKAGAQDVQVYAAFWERWVGRRLAPSEVHAAFPAWPITSIRRALSNLAARGLLVHFPADRRPGPRGAKESTWGLA